VTVLEKYQPDLVVIESCGLAGWVHDVCTAEGCKVLVCNPSQEAWKWKNIKRKADRDDALKLATGSTTAAGSAGRSGLVDAPIQSLGQVGLRPTHQRPKDAEEESDRSSGS
jgi:transposase